VSNRSLINPERLEQLRQFFGTLPAMSNESFELGTRDAKITRNRLDL